MAIGRRTLTALALLAGSLVLLWSRGRLRGDYLAQLDPWVALLAAGLAVIVGSAGYRFLRLHQRGLVGFSSFRRAGRALTPGWSGEAEERGAAWWGPLPGPGGPELPPWALRLVAILVCFCVGFMNLNNRAVALLADTPRRLGQSKAQVCAPAEPEEDVPGSPEQGCELLRRAYRLGYADDLGSCGPKEGEDEVPDLCRRRQADEPYLHYAWRLLADQADRLRTGTRRKNLGARVEQLEYQSRYVGALARSHHDTVAVARRSAHHLFTNLTNPRHSRRDQVARFLDPRWCVRQYARMPHLLAQARGESRPGLVLEHVVGHLLFNPAYQPVVGFCRELTIHYDAPSNSCKRLADHPQKFLREHQALESVAATLGRRERHQINQKLGLGARPSREGPAPLIERLVSFQCLVFDPGSDEADVREYPVTIDSEVLRARELRRASLETDERGQIELFQQLAILLAPGFGYGRVASRETIGDGAPSAGRSSNLPVSEQFQPSSYLLTQLELLRDTDLFLGHQWIYERRDLLEVYPYHLHLANFIEVFRQYYQHQRGRL
jgi:hypothetical protein